MSFQFNSDREQIRGVDSTIIGSNSVRLRAGAGSNEREIVQAVIDSGTNLPRVGINRTGRRVERIDVTSPGSGYTDTPTVNFSPPTLPGGKVPVATADTDSLGRIISILIDDPGDGYEIPPTVDITGGNGFGGSGQAFLDTIDFELDINGAIRTSTSIISDTANILNLDIDNLVTPDIKVRAPHLKVFLNGVGTPFPDNAVPVQRNSYFFSGKNVYQALNTGVCDILPPTHEDGTVLNGDVQFKHIGFRVDAPNDKFYGEGGDSGIFPRAITPLLGDRSDKIATTEYVLNLATNDVGGRIYVSELIGNDNNDGRSPVNPVRTIKRACQLAWETPGVKESIIIAGGNYLEDNPISIPPDASIVGDNLRLVIIRPDNPGKHIFKFGDKNYVIGVTYQDKVNSSGASTGTWDFAMVFDDKQRVTYDASANGDFGINFPVGHQFFGPQKFKASFSFNTGLSNLVAGQIARGVSSGVIARINQVTFDETDANEPGAFATGSIFDVVGISGTFQSSESFRYGGAGTLKWDGETVYQLGDLVWNIDSVYEVTTAGTSGTVGPTHTNATATTDDAGQVFYTYVRDAYEFNANNVTSTRAEGEVVFEGRDEAVQPVVEVPVVRVDFSLQGTFTDGFQNDIYGNAEDLGGVVFYTNLLEGANNVHDFKEGEEIEIIGMPTGTPNLGFLNGKQRIYKVIEDADGRARRFIIPKKIDPTLGLNANSYWNPETEGAVVSVRTASKSVTLSLLNSPNKFPISQPVDRRYQDACLQIKNNLDFIADEVVQKVNDQFKKDYFSVYDTTINEFKIFVGPSRFVHNYVSGGTVHFGGNTYNITNLVYDQDGTGEVTITTSGAHGLTEDDTVRLANILLSCTIDNVVTQKIYPSFNIPISDEKCRRDVKHFLNALTRDLEYGSNYNIITDALKYVSAGQIDFVDYEIIQTVRAIEYARELAIYAMRKWRTGNGLTDPVYSPQYTTLDAYIDPTIIDDLTGSPTCANVANAINTLSYLFVDVISNNASGTYLDAAYLISRNRDHIADEAYLLTKQQYPSLALNNIDERKCRRDINLILNGVLRDLVLGGNTGSVDAAEKYYTGTTLSGLPISELGSTRYAFGKVRDMSIQAMRNWKTSSGSTVTPTFTDIPQFTDLTILVDANGTPTAQLTPTDATYDPSNGDFEMTFASAHGVTLTDSIRLQVESFVFTCGMDGNKSEHYLPESDQPAATALLPVTGVTANTITVNVGASGPDVSFDPTDATYDPATGDFVITIGSHTLTTGEGIVLDDNSFTFTCEMDDDDAQKTYPRPGIDPYAGKSLKITSATQDTITVNVGASAPNKYFTPTAVTYDPVSGDMVVTVGQHGLGVGRSVVLEDNSFSFTCALNNDQTQHTYPRPGTDPYAGKSIAITAVGNTTHTPTDAVYDVEDGEITFTLSNHGFANGDYIKIDDDAITYTCTLDSNASQHTYPRSHDYGSGRWFAISDVQQNTFKITGLPIPRDLSAHTFVSFAANGLKRQDGTFTINVGTSSDTSQHTWVGSTANAIKHEPQSVHTFVSATTGAVKHLPQSTHTFRRVTGSNVVAAYPSGGNAVCANVEASLQTSFGIIDGILEYAADPSSNTAIQPGTTTRTTGTLYAGDDVISYPDNVLRDASGNYITIRAVYDDLPIISASPYTQNASIISKIGGSGALIDGSKVKSPNCPFPGLTDGKATFPNQGKSMVASAFTIVSEKNGTGYKIIEDGYVQLVSVFCIFCVDGILAESGGYASVTNSASNFGQFALRSTGFRAEAYEFDAGYRTSGGYNLAYIDVVSESVTGNTEFTIDNIGRVPLEHYIVKIDGYDSADLEDEYFIDKVELLREGPPYRARITITDGSGGGAASFRDKTTGNIVANSTLSTKYISLHRPSIVNSSSHTWEFVGSGTTYDALPENGGVKVDSNEQVSENYGRTYVSGTDELGDFKVGTFAKIENRTGNITFTGTVSISEVEFLKLRGGDVVVTGFDNSNTLGGSQSSDSKLPTQKAVRDYITNNLGQYINKNYSTNALPRALVELNDSGKISESQLPPISPINVFSVDTQAERLALEGVNAGDIVIEDGTPFILNTDNDSVFLAIVPDTSLQFTTFDVFTGSNTGGKIQLNEYRPGVIREITITDAGSGYSSAPAIVINDSSLGTQLGHVPAAAEATVVNGEIVSITIQNSNGLIGGKGYLDDTNNRVTITFSGGGGSGAQAEVFLESRLYGDIVNNIKPVANETIESSDVPAETVTISRVVNTSGSNNANWTSLSTSTVDASDIIGIIPTSKLAADNEAANSNTALFGDQSYKKVVKSIRATELRYFIKTADVSGSDTLLFSASDSNVGNLLIGHGIVNVTGVQAGTTISQIADITVGATVYKRITLSDGLTSSVASGTIIEFVRPASPVLLESLIPTADFVESVQIENGGTGFDNGTFNNVQITPTNAGSDVSGLQLKFVIENGTVTSCTVDNGGNGFENDFLLSDIPTETIGNGSGLILRIKVNTEDKLHSDVGIDVARTTNDTLSDEDYGTVGVARFKKSQFDVVANGAVSLFTGIDSGLDADLLDGQQGSYYRNADNINAGILDPAFLSSTQTYNISISQSSGETAKLTSKSGSLLADAAPRELVDGGSIDVRRNSTNGLLDPEFKEAIDQQTGETTLVSTANDYNTVLSIRGGGDDTSNPYGGVVQLGFTNANNVWIRGSSASVSTTATFSAWAKLWSSGNDYSGDPADSRSIAGPNAYRLRSRTGKWYQNASTMIYGRVLDNRLPSYQTAKDFNTKIRLLDDSGAGVRYSIYILRVTAAVVNTLENNSLFTSSPFVVKLLDAFGNDPGEISISNISIFNNDGTILDTTSSTIDYNQVYAVVTGTLIVGTFTGAVEIGDNTVQIPFDDFTISEYDGNADGMPDGNIEISRLESDNGTAKFFLGRADGVANSQTSPTIYFRSSEDGGTGNFYTAALQASGGTDALGSGSLNVLITSPNEFKVGGNTVWNAGNVVFNSTNTPSTTDAQGNITLKSAVFRDANGDFAAGTITASLTGLASLNLPLTGGTLTGTLNIGDSNNDRALNVYGPTSLFGTLGVEDDLTVDAGTLFVDASENKVGIGTTSFTVDTQAKLTLDAGSSTIGVVALTGGGSNLGSGLRMYHQGGGARTGFSGRWAVQFGCDQTDFVAGQNNLGQTEGLYFSHTDGSTTGVPLILKRNKDVIVPFKLGVGTKTPGFAMEVVGDAKIKTALTVGDSGDNNGAPIYFLGATGGLVGGTTTYLSNFRVGNQMTGSDMFEITAGDHGNVNADWKSTPAVAIKGSTNQVGVNTTSFGGTDPEKTDANGNPIEREYALNVQGDINFNGLVFQDNAEFVTSRWTEAPNETDIYRATKVGINFQTAKNPDYELEVDGDIGLTGSMYANDDPLWLDSFGVIKVNRATLAEDVTITAGLNAVSNGPIVINSGTITVDAGATWVIT